RADIERTRHELGSDVDALADKVTPSKIVHRQTGKVKRALGSVSERVMGSADDAQSAAADAVGQVGDQAKSLAHDAKAKAEGNPLAVGLVAFGLGMIAASLIPASSREKEIAQTVKTEAGPLVDEMTDSAKNIASHLQEPAREAADAMKDQLSDSAARVKGE